MVKDYEVNNKQTNKQNPTYYFNSELSISSWPVTAFTSAPIFLSFIQHQQQKQIYAM